MIVGSPVTYNHTPSTVGLMCVGQEIKGLYAPTKQRITIGDVPDLSGKFEETFGNRLTQGAAAMGMSALGKMNGAVTIVERGDTGVFEFDLDLAAKKILGDNGKYKLPGGQTVRYRPIVSGSVAGTDFYITGALTEMNYNIGSSGGELDVSGWMAGARRYTSNVAGDFRIVNSRTLEVMDTLTLQKQVVGYETKAGVFRFFGVELVDLNMGNKKDEPMQLAVRALLEEAIGILVATTHGIDGYGIFYRVNQENTFSERWMRDPREIMEEICPKPERVVQEQPAPQPPVVAKPKQKNRYIGACTDLSKCEMCNIADAPEFEELGSGPHVQVASFRNPTKPKREASCLVHEFPEQFGDKDFTVKRENVGGSTWNSLLVPMESKQEALEFCKEVKARGLDCYNRTIK